MPQRTVLIAGPTAGGKSRYAMELARAENGVIINADSMQIYADLRVLTARPTPEDEADVPHLLYGHVPISEAYSVRRWLDDVAGAIEGVRAVGKFPILVGGTGLYFKVLLEGLSPVPDIPNAVRAYWRHRSTQLPKDQLYAELLRRDAQTAARLRPSDSQRVVRALEVVDATGQGLSIWQSVPGFGLMREDEVRGIVVAPARLDLYARAEARFDGMLKAGAIEEAERMRLRLADGLSPDLPGIGALGLRPLLSYLDGDLGLAEATSQAKRDTRHYIKRQLTWLRRNMIAWYWLAQ